MTIFSYYTTKLGFDADAIAIFNRMPNELLSIEKAIINDWVIASKASGNFSKYDYLYGFFLSDRDNALTDWITGKTATAVNSPTHTANQGFLFSASGQYIDSNIDLRLDSTNYKTDLADLGVYVYSNNNTGSNKYISGAANSVDDQITGLLQVPTVPRLQGFVNITFIQAVIDTNSSFFVPNTRYAVKRLLNDDIQLLENSNVIGSNNLVSNGIPTNTNLYFGARSTDGSPSSTYLGALSYGYTGGDLDETALNTELAILENNLIS